LPISIPSGRPDRLGDGSVLVDIDTLSFGNYRIGAIDISSRYGRWPASRRAAPNPEFGADGTLYRDPDGIPNVYRLPNAMLGGSATRVTNVVSGVRASRR
jgi:hypothetical protein